MAISDLGQRVANAIPASRIQVPIRARPTFRPDAENSAEAFAPIPETLYHQIDICILVPRR